MIQLFNVKLERVTERGQQKLHPYPLEVMDDSLGRSIYQFNQSISLSIINEQDESSLP